MYNFCKKHILKYTMHKILKSKFVHSRNKNIN